MRRDFNGWYTGMQPRSPHGSEKVRRLLHTYASLNHAFPPGGVDDATRRGMAKSNVGGHGTQITVSFCFLLSLPVQQQPKNAEVLSSLASSCVYRTPSSHALEARFTRIGVR